ncbi:MAG: membrane protein insertion efficiency factor YidD [Anaerolineaceae bacterium]|nr:membrane protein insertion efficiency factor YidD [Anaerolineaceae bacterium]
MNIEQNQTPILNEYHSEPKLFDLPFNWQTILRWPFLLLLRIYQKTISKALPPDTCRYYPSCSHYSYQSIYKFGVLKGSLLSIWRVLRCNPFSSGGFDPIPESFKSLKEWKFIRNYTLDVKTDEKS